MKSILIPSALVAVFGVVSGSFALHAQTTNTTTASTTTSTMAAPAAKLTKTPYRGMVKSVDTAANSITVTNKKGDMTFMVDTKTKITRDKKSATLADITMGEKVTGSFTKDASGTMTACKINGHSMAAATTASSSSSMSTSTTTTNAAPSTP